MEQAYNYQNVIKKIIEEKTKSSNTLLMALSGQAGTISAKDIPEFVYEAPSFLKYLPRVILDLSILIILNLIFFAGSFFAFLKFDLR